MNCYETGALSNVTKADIVIDEVSTYCDNYASTNSFVEVFFWMNYGFGDQPNLVDSDASMQVSLGVFSSIFNIRNLSWDCSDQSFEGLLNRDLGSPHSLLRASFGVF